MSAILLDHKNVARGQLDATLTAAATTIVLKTGEGAEFPQPLSGAASSTGDSETLNDTGDLGSLAVGDFIRNVTDGSWAYVTSISGAPDSVTTTRLIGGSDNTWTSGDVWRHGEFIVTLIKTDDGTAEGEVTQRERVLISGRSTDQLTVPSGGRGYDGTSGQEFDVDDFVNLHVTALSFDYLRDGLYDISNIINTMRDLDEDLQSTANAKGASLIGVEDSAANFSGTDVEAVLAEIQGNIDTLSASALTLQNLGFFGDGSDGSKTVSSSEDIDPAAPWNYTDLTVNSGQTLGVDTVNEPLVLLISGDATINGTIDLNSKGGAGGAAGANNASGGDATAGASLVSGWTAGGGGGGTKGGTGAAGGGGGASFFSAGSAGTQTGASTAGTAGAAISTINFLFLTNLARAVVCGGGGGGGSGGGSGTGFVGGAGGAGGGAMIMYVAGDLTLGASSVIRANGGNGGNGTGDGGGGGQDGAGGGAGAGGCVVVIVGGSITDSGVTVSASAGSAGSPPDSGAPGGAAGAGKVLIYSLSTGTLIAS